MARLADSRRSRRVVCSFDTGVRWIEGEVEPRSQQQRREPKKLGILREILETVILILEPSILPLQIARKNS